MGKVKQYATELAEDLFERFVDEGHHPEIAHEMAQAAIFGISEETAQFCLKGSL